MTTCSRCGADNPSGAGASILCPACLLRLGLDAPEGLEELDVMAGFRVLAPIGCGPEATVYLARTRDDDAGLVTVKLFDSPVDPSRFVARVRELVTRMEGCAAAPHLTIPNAGIVDASHVFVAARYVPGTALGAYCRDVARREQDALLLFAHLCRLVAQLHRAGIVHAAIKPSNVIVVPAAKRAEPVLLDTGVRAALDASRVGFASMSRGAVLRMPDRRGDLAGLRKLAADLFAGRRGSEHGPELIQALARREFETASELAEEAAALAGLAS